MPEFVSTVQLLADHATRRPDSIAHTVAWMREDGTLDHRDLTFADWKTDAEQMSACIVDAAPKPRVIATVGSPEVFPEVATAYLAAHLLGATYTVLPIGYGPDELSRIVAQLGVDVLLITNGEVSDYEYLQLPVLNVAKVRMKAYAGTRAPVPQDSLSATEPASIVFTSGSTQQPKAIAMVHSDLTFESHATDPPQVGTTPNASFLHSSPPHVVDGHFMALRPLLRGLRVITLVKFDARLWWTAVQECRVTDVAVVPTLAHELVEEAKRRKYDVSGLHRMTLGSAALSGSLAEELLRILPDTELSVDYSLTESGRAGVLGPVHPDRPQVVGRPYPWAEARIVDPAGQEISEPGTHGEIQLRSLGAPQRHYWQGGLLGPACCGEGGWVATGDLGCFDEARRLSVIGRIKDVINVGGLKVHAREVEEALQQLDGVRLAGVIGTPHPLLGEEVVGVVEGAPELDSGRLLHSLRLILPAWKVPAEIMKVEQIPLTATNKIDKGALSKLYSRMQKLAALYLPSYNSAYLTKMLSDIGVSVTSGEESAIALESLQAVRLRARLRDQFAVDISLEVLLTNQKLGELDQRIAGLNQQAGVNS